VTAPVDPSSPLFAPSPFISPSINKLNFPGSDKAAAQVDVLTLRFIVSVVVGLVEELELPEEEDPGVGVGVGVAVGAIGAVVGVGVGVTFAFGVGVGVGVCVGVGVTSVLAPFTSGISYWSASTGISRKIKRMIDKKVKNVVALFFSE